ncbi:YwdI family protein [Geobacillus thermocatenulatus]|uniref:YwdI family protein n=1 Tax=Geobacillus thermocatenulatus TaxID=33938 RepID=UPI0004736111|nr:YwdI family protein [Geobacillus thermocatenulatus]
MSISFTAVVAKMEDELRKAKAANNLQRMREHIAAVRALCDLMLETTGQPQPSVSSVSTEPLVVGGPISVAGGLSLGAVSVQGRSPDIDDEANGESLLDF